MRHTSSIYAADDSSPEWVERHLADLHAHCYRMLGSLDDADDALQEALLRAWRGRRGFGGRSSVRTWLHRIATNVCLDMIRRRRGRIVTADRHPIATRADQQPRTQDSRIESYPNEPMSVAEDTVSPDARYERRESLELAFVAALQHLPARQRAALVLRDVLGFSAKEAAEALDTTVASVNGAVRRARVSVRERLPDHGQLAALRAIGNRDLRELGERFADAFERGDVEAILALVTRGATPRMPSHAESCDAQNAVGRSRRKSVATPGRPRPAGRSDLRRPALP